jgi:hypothetical protein
MNADKADQNEVNFVPMITLSKLDGCSQGQETFVAFFAFIGVPLSAFICVPRFRSTAKHKAAP